jgi:putative heme-binding domain-containing protein
MALVGILGGAVRTGIHSSAFAGPPVAPTEALSPAEQRTHFKLPPGFEIQLVAAEPDIQKPMNLAFDARGRLWVTHSIEYPFAAADGSQARDGLTILSDFGADGRAKKAEKFADKLNIPIGVLPLGAGTEAIVWSIPHLWKLSDEDGDGRAEKREVLYGPFDFADTHGNQNALRLMPDGWVYACHGFRNDSQVKLRGEGPVVLRMTSGNTYRFRPDGSAIEQMTWGQVNPFGMCFDRYGLAYNADCHSKPITQLLRGGYYESFGKPHDGLGYAPSMTSHGHDSTGIAGVAFYDAPQFPPEYRDCFYVGNVVTNVVHRDKPRWRGSSPWIDAPVDFISCSDPWFHPVDIQLGPDGALYIADFYNSIIGHYEVDLRHPRRDRHRGRIWRVVYRGTDGAADGSRNNALNSAPNSASNTASNSAPNTASNSPPNSATTAGDLATLPPEKLVERLSDANLAIRRHATLELQRRGDAASLAAATRLPVDSAGAPLAVWLARDAAALGARVAADQSGAAPLPPLVKTQVLAAVGELPQWDRPMAEWVRRQLSDADPFVRRFAAAATAQHPDVANTLPLLDAFARVDATDELLAHNLKIALRNQFRAPDALATLSSSATKLGPERLAFVAEMALAIPEPNAALWAFRQTRDVMFPAARSAAALPPLLERAAQQVARWAEPVALDEIVAFAERELASDHARQRTLLQAVVTGWRQRSGGGEPTANARRWAESAIRRLLDPNQPTAAAWTALPLEAADAAVSGGSGGGTGSTAGGGGAARPANGSAWGVKNRKCADGREIPVFDSIVGGESMTGVLRSAPFPLPNSLSFWICGQNGMPGANPPQRNRVQLRLIGTADAVRSATTPRNDTAQQVNWDLKPWAGRQGFIEIVDADASASYAWVGAGRFEPPVVAEPAAGASPAAAPQELAIQTIELWKLSGLSSTLVALLDDPAAAPAIRAAAAQAAFALDASATQPKLVAAVVDNQAPAGLRTKAAELLAAGNTESARKPILDALATAPASLQPGLALALTSHRDGAEALLATIQAGKASPRLLQEKSVLDRLKGAAPDRWEQRVAALTAGLPAVEERLKQAQRDRLDTWQTKRGDLANGQLLMKKHCAACHKAAGEGAMVGPQLDGVGNRGPERLMEDVLDPNRNVDAAFRATILVKSDGQVVSGLKLREEGGSIVLANQEGKEVRVAASDVEESRVSGLSLMPANFADTLPARDMADLLEYLLSLKGRP